MTAGLAADGGPDGTRSAVPPSRPGRGPDEDRSPSPPAGMVLHRVLAGSARTFLLNDMGNELLDETKRCQTVGALNIHDADPAGVGPVRGQRARREPAAATQTERIHQSRVAMRRIRSNLRTFRLLLDPAWGTSLRAELAWYGELPGPGPGPQHHRRS